MRNYYLHDNRVDIVRNDGSVLTIYFNENSGKVYYRYKIDTITGIKHPGIFLGVDNWNVEYFLHNHYHIGRAEIVTGNNFRNGQDIFLYNEMCSNAPLKVVEIGLNQVLSGRSYNFITYNCQTFTNQACNNVSKSDTIEKWAAGLLFVGLASLLIGAVAKK